MTPVSFSALKTASMVQPATAGSRVGDFGTSMYARPSKRRALRPSRPATRDGPDGPAVVAPPRGVDDLVSRVLVELISEHIGVHRRIRRALLRVVRERRNLKLDRVLLPLVLGLQVPPQRGVRGSATRFLSS